MDKEILSYYGEFNEEVKQDMKDNEGSTFNESFKRVFLSYLGEKDIAVLADMTLVDYKKDSLNIRIDGYTYSEYFHSLTLLVTDPNTSATPSNLVKKDIDKYLKRGLNFLKKCVKNDDYFNSIEPTSDGYIAYNAIKEVEDNVESINIILLTNNIARQYVPDDVKVKKITVKFDVYDFERLYHVIMEDNSDYKPLIIRLKNKYGKSLQMIKAEGSNPTYDCYVGIIPGELLARIYSDEGQDLIQKNVRSYLQARGKVNRGIKNTLAKEPEMFMAYNNGISTIADSVELESFDSNNQVVSIKEITGWQIVNGGQTTASVV